MLWSALSTKSRLRELEEMVAKLEARIEELKHQAETRDLDWTEMRARCKRLLDRTEKAYSQLADAERNGELPFPNKETEIRLPSGVLGATSERMAKIRQQLAGGQGGKKE